MRGTQQVINIKQGAPVTIPIITFSESKGRPVMAPFDDPVVIELKVASALIPGTRSTSFLGSASKSSSIQAGILPPLLIPFEDSMGRCLTRSGGICAHHVKCHPGKANPPQSKGRDSTLPATDPLFGDQHMTVSIKPFVGHERSEEPAVPKKPHVEEPALVEASLICVMEIEDLK
ncbi:hypothetical protein Cgig2_032899 [Carnegiea gigantea]|uniref:Uncharacterized protein n=1 Tax=Carnegiea gigantea TaxID=171969 RepID=A0A9Q1JXC0_9CARY|nr:hypothetical protein Cgig2_032899 [Carnegiea gigantea]